VYRATRLSAPNQVWAPNVLRALGDVVEPTTGDGYYYTVTEVDGTNPRSGTLEPSWNATDGATTIEDTQDTTPITPAAAATPTAVIPGSIESRYGNPASPIIRST